MPLVLRGIGLESGILVQKFAVRQGSAGRCKHRALQGVLLFAAHFQIATTLRQYRIILSADTASEVRQPPERCLSRKAGIVRCCPNY